MDRFGRGEIGVEARRSRHPRCVPETLRQPASANWRTTHATEFQKPPLFFDFFAPRPNQFRFSPSRWMTNAFPGTPGAVELALREFETFARHGFGKAAFRSWTERPAMFSARPLSYHFPALDPQLHTHFVLFEFNCDPRGATPEGSANRRHVRCIHYGTAVYRNELVHARSNRLSDSQPPTLSRSRACHPVD